jgi:RNA polymerase sigma-70 factor (ECF subfamily)
MQVEAASASFDFETVFLAHYEPIARAIARILKDPGRAEELAVETFLKLHRNPDALGPQTGGWLYRCAVRLALDELRRSARQARHQQMVAFLTGPFSKKPRTPHELFSDNEEQGKVRTVLASLTSRHAELLVLRSNDLSYEEVASSLSIPSASVGTLLSRAQQAFRKEYTKRYGEPTEL